MRFLRKLINREEYEPLPFYSGLPSSTPAVQGEIFYGVKTVVPTFSFRDHRTGNDVFMYHAESVQAGGRKTPQTCRRTSRGWKRLCRHLYRRGQGIPIFAPLRSDGTIFIRETSLARILSVCFFYSPLLLRVAALLLIEFGLAIYDSIHGIIGGGGQLIKEIKFIPTRVSICVLLRELITIGVRMDAARGLPVIHANFLGYDEQSHRRGPSSAFAHWTLKGIDKSIRDIWNSAKRSNRRNYDLWIYSDHGQEHTEPYFERMGQSLEEGRGDGAAGGRIVGAGGADAETKRHSTQTRGVAWPKFQLVVERSDEQEYLS